MTSSIYKYGKFAICCILASPLFLIYAVLLGVRMSLVTLFFTIQLVWTLNDLEEVKA